VLIDSIDMSSITKATRPPVSSPPSWPFVGKSPHEMWEFAQEHVKYPIFNSAFAILDDQTVRDKETCLLVTKRQSPQSTKLDLITVRSDFKTAMIILNVLNLGIGGDRALQTYQLGGDNPL
jgi:hypothetical protein